MIASNPLFRTWKRLQSLASRNRGPQHSPASRGGRDAPTVGTQLVPADSPLDGFLPSETFVALFDSQARCSSARFRELTGWQPTIPFADAMVETRRWADLYLHASDACFAEFSKY